MAKSKGREENGSDIYNFPWSRHCAWSFTCICLDIMVQYYVLPWNQGGWVRTIKCPNHKLLSNSPHVGKAPKPKNPSYHDMDQVQFPLILQQQVSIPCQPTELFIQANHILLWEMGGGGSHPLSTTNPTSHGPWLSICSLVQPCVACDVCVLSSLPPGPEYLWLLTAVISSVQCRVLLGHPHCPFHQQGK